jgi:hypothetical protein
MDRLERYRRIVKEILTEHSQIKPVYGEVQMQLMFDVERDRYSAYQASMAHLRVRSFARVVPLR